MEDIDVEDADPTAGDYYERIAASPEFTDEEIDSAADKIFHEYSVRVRTTDSVTPRMYQQIQDARKTLTDPDKRATYDVFIELLDSDSPAEKYEAWQRANGSPSPEDWIESNSERHKSQNKTDNSKADNQGASSTKSSFKYSTSSSTGKRGDKKGSDSQTTNDSATENTAETGSSASYSTSDSSSQRSSTGYGSDKDFESSGARSSQEQDFDTASEEAGSNSNENNSDTGNNTYSTSKSSGSQHSSTTDTKPSGDHDAGFKSRIIGLSLFLVSAIKKHAALHISALFADGGSVAVLSLGSVFSHPIWFALSILLLILSGILGILYGILNWFVELLTPMSIALPSWFGDGAFELLVILFGLLLIWTTGLSASFAHNTILAGLIGDADTDKTAIGIDTTMTQRWTLIAIPLIPVAYLFQDFTLTISPTFKWTVIGWVSVMIFLGRVVSLSIDKWFIVPYLGWLIGSTAALGSVHVVLSNYYYPELGEEIIHIWEVTGIPPEPGLLLGLVTMLGVFLFLTTELVRLVSFTLQKI